MRTTRIDLYSVFGTDTLRDRQTAHLVLDKIASVPSNDLVIIDFAKINFASRSFCHELLTALRNRENVKFENRNEEVARMMMIAVAKPTINQDFPFKTIILC